MGRHSPISRELPVVVGVPVAVEALTPPLVLLSVSCSAHPAAVAGVAVLQIRYNDGEAAGTRKTYP